MKTQKQHPMTWAQYVGNTDYEVYRNKGANTRFRNKRTSAIGPWVRNPSALTRRFREIAGNIEAASADVSKRFADAMEATRKNTFGTNVLTKHITKVTKDELCAALDHHGVEYDRKSTKADLRALLQDTLR